MNKIVAFVTGGSSGLGAATVSHLIKKGAAGCYVLDTQRYQNPERFANVHSFQGTIENEEHVTRALEDCYEKFKKINLVVNCAGVSVAFKIFNFNLGQPQSKSDFEKVMAVSVFEVIDWDDSPPAVGLSICRPLVEHSKCLLCEIVVDHL